MRRRVLRLPPQNVGIQTEPSSATSVGQQTDDALPQNEEQGANAGISEEPADAMTPQENAVVLFHSEQRRADRSTRFILNPNLSFSDYDWQGVVALQRSHWDIERHIPSYLRPQRARRNTLKLSLLFLQRRIVVIVLEHILVMTILRVIINLAQAVISYRIDPRGIETVLNSLFIPSLVVKMLYSCRNLKDNGR